MPPPSNDDLADGAAAAAAVVVEVVVGRGKNEDHGGGGFDARCSFASSNCWGRRPLLVRGAYDADSLLGRDRRHEKGQGEDDVHDHKDELSSSSFASWPTWEEVVDIASDVDSESR
jgi:hypothetical protein